MFKKRGLLLVMLSMLMGVGAAWVANNWVQGRGVSTADADTATATVLAAAMTIPYGTKLEPRHLRTMKMPDSAVPNGAVRDTAEIEGWIATSEILEGELLMKGRFVEHLAGSTLAAMVAPNKRAVSVRVNDVAGVAGFLLPGNYVDVLGTRLERGSRRAVTSTIIQNVKVLAVDQTARTDDDNEPVVVRAVTLELDPKQAEELVKWEEEGSLQLALRNPLDSQLVQEPEKPAPAVRQQAPVDTGTSVQVIKGTIVKKTKTKG